MFATFTQLKTLSFFKWTLLICFACLIGIEIGYISTDKYNVTSQNRILILLFLIAVIQFKNKHTWILAMIFFLYGLYFMIVESVSYSDTVALDFTAQLHRLVRDHLNKTENIFFQGFPIYFYFLSFLIFTAPPVRRWYGISTKKTPKIKAYH